MKSVSISGSIRKSVGRKDANLNRKEGNIPAVLYGGKEQFHFTIKAFDFEKIVNTPEVYLLNIDLEGTKHDAIIQDIQIHPVTDEIIHVDFLQIISGKSITMKIPVKFKGTAEGVLKGGVLLKKMKTIKVKALPEFLPDTIDIDISKLDIGNSIRISDIKLDNLELLELPTAVVVGVRTARTVVETAEGATPAEGAAPAEGATPAAATPAKEDKGKKS